MQPTKSRRMPKRILIVDDEEDMREITQISLEVMGWEVITATCGSEGIARAEAERPDAILLDVMMPEMDGPTTYGHLRGGVTTRDIPVILLTGKVNADDQRRFAALQVRGVLSKPFDPTRLGSDVAAILGWED